MVNFFMQALAAGVVLVAGSSMHADAALMRSLQERTSASSEPAAPSSRVLCGMQASQENLTAGIDILTDASCVNGGVGCIGTVCRYCTHPGSTTSIAYPTCLSIYQSTYGPTEAKSFAGLSYISGTSATFATVNIVGGAAAVVAVVAVAFTAKKTVQARNAAKAAESITPSGSLVYRRASVFQI